MNIINENMTLRDLHDTYIRLNCTFPECFYAIVFDAGVPKIEMQERIDLGD